MARVVFIFAFLFGAVVFGQDIIRATPQVTPMPEALEVPPEWLVMVLQSLYELPIVGPYVSKIVQWLGVLSVALTALTGAMLIILKSLSTVMDKTKVLTFSDKVKAFEQSKVIYWLKYFSLFNAQKK